MEVGSDLVGLDPCPPAFVASVGLLRRKLSQCPGSGSGPPEEGSLGELSKGKFRFCREEKNCKLYLKYSWIKEA